LEAVALDGSEFVPAPAPASGPASAPVASVAALQVKFEIKNYNYMDLTRKTCPETEEQALNAPPKTKTKRPVPDKSKEVDLDIVRIPDEVKTVKVKPIKGEVPKVEKPPKVPIETGTGLGEHVNKVIGQDVDNINDVAKGKKVHVLPEVPKKVEKSVEEDVQNTEQVAEGDVPDVKVPGAEVKVKGASFLETAYNMETAACKVQHSSLAAIHAQSDACKTVMDVFRDATKEVVRNTIKCAFNSMIAKGSSFAPAPAMASPAPAAFLQHNQQPASPAPATPGPVEPDVSIFVTFSPGREVGNGRSVIVEITFTDKPNGQDDVAMVNQILQNAIDSGLLLKELKDMLTMITGLYPKVGPVKMQAKAIEAWNVEKCEKHITHLVNDFSRTYTRERVPQALFNECTNFMTKLSFSNDIILDPQDTEMCRKATARFAKRWNFGEKAEPKDFEIMCVRSCEYKFGKNAPQCNIETGDALAKQPL